MFLLSLVVFACTCVLLLHVARLKYRSFFNPISIVITLFVLHNGLRCFFYALGRRDLFLEALPNYFYMFNEADLIVVTYINIIGLLCLCFPLIVKSNKMITNWEACFSKVGNIFYAVKIEKFCVVLYLTFTVLYCLRNFELLFVDGFIYGENQSLTAQEAFGPIGVFLSLRTYFLMLLIFLNRRGTRKSLLKYILLELTLQFLTGGRKSIVLCLGAYTIFSIKDHFKVLRLSKCLRLSAIIFISFYSLTLITSTRGRIELLSEPDIYIKNLEEFQDKMATAADVSHLPCWVLDCVKERDLSKLYGKSYVQAAVNIFIPRPYQGELINSQAAFYFKQYAYPELRNHGYDFSFTAEAILNFGVLYSFIPFLFLGFMYRLILNRTNKNLFFQFLFLFLLISPIIYFRTDSTSFIRSISLFVFSYCFIWAISPLKNLSTK